MKKLVLTMIVGLGFGMFANAQTDKGTITIGGNFGYDYSKVVDVDGHVQNYSIMPKIGYLVQDNLELGLGLGYAGSTDTDSFDVKSTIGEFAVAPYLRKFYGNSDVKFFSQVAVPMGWGKAKHDGTEIGTTERYGVALSPGIAYSPKSNFAVELSIKGLYYEYASVTPDAGAKVASNTFGLNANSFMPSIGFNFYF